MNYFKVFYFAGNVKNEQIDKNQTLLFLTAIFGNLVNLTAVQKRIKKNK